MAEQYLKCPNCGANATNHQNCEYCGSLLVRFVEKGIDLSKTTYMSNDGVFPGLAEELHRNLSMQRENPGFFTATDIYYDIYMCISVLRTGFSLWKDKTKIESYGKTEGFIIVFEQWYNPNPIGLDEEQEEYNNHYLRFKQLESSKLFTQRTYETTDDGWEHYEYALDFGCDADGAARLISEIIQKVYMVPLSQKIDIETAVGSDNVNNMRNQYRIKHGFEPLEDEEDGEWPWWYYVVGGLILAAIGKLFF